MSRRDRAVVLFNETLAGAAAWLLIPLAVLLVLTLILAAFE